MRRDSIFYKLFQQAPDLLFELLENKPINAKEYRFDSVAVKEPRFEIDGVFLPPESDSPGIPYYCEVQFQPDQQLYERLFGESFLHFYRNRDRFSDLQLVVIYPSRNVEQSNYHPYRALINSDQVHRIYLDELGAIAQLPLGVALMVLTILSEQEAPAAARSLLGRAAQEVASLGEKQGIIEMINTIMIYKFTNLSRQEIDEMLGTKLEETRVYREAREEERQAIATNLTNLSRQEIDEMLGTKLEETRVYQEAQEEKTIATALNLLRENISLETIARTTGLTIAQLQQLQAENQ
jgi:predicted transposase/invertase (TIGR01784 family)